MKSATGLTQMKDGRTHLKVSTNADQTHGPGGKT
jgi:hypothetical protein